MSHPLHRVESFEQTGPYSLRIRFEDGLVRTIDFEPVLHGELFGPLRDPTVFAQVSVDPEVHTLVWESGADFDPATLHDWPEHEAAFKTAAQKWSNQQIHRTPR
jgi:hypothetical protein